MDPIDDLLHCVLEAPEAEWSGQLESLCTAHAGSATELRRRFDVLRRFGIAHDEPGGEAGEKLPRRFGDLELLERLGGGGMGVVYLARDPRLDREVAVKLVRPEQLCFAGAAERFRREIAVVARLEHPAIVTVHATGAVQGIPYLVMERIVGRSLDDVIRALAGRAPATLQGADLAAIVGDRAGEAGRFAGAWVAVCLRIAHEIALALAHAHARGIVHRDVKPSNVMLTASGRVVLLDFGLALTPGIDRMTRAGAHLGSLPYMSPEQVRGDHAAVGARCDVYSLGVLLYELLTLVSPHDATSSEQTRKSILEGTRTPVRLRNRAVPVDVASVLDKALDVDPRRRYQHAADLAQDLDNALHDREVTARPTRVWLRGARWSRRNPGWAVGLVLGVLLLGGVPTGTALGIASQRGRALAAEQLARVNAYTANIAAAKIALEGGDAAAAKRRLDACAEDLRGWEWHHLRLSLDASVMTLADATQPIHAVALAADLGCVASGGNNGEVCVWELPSGALRYRDVSFGEAVDTLRLCADGQSLIVCGRSGRLRRVDWATGAVRVDQDQPAGFAAVVISTDGSRLWRNDGGWSVAELDPRSLQALRTIVLPHAARAPGARFLCTSTRMLDLTGERATLWDLAGGQPCVRGARLDPMVTCAALAPGGGLAAVGGTRGRIRILDMVTGGLVRDFSAGAADLRDLAFTSDGSALVGVAADRALRVWDLTDGALVTTLQGHDGEVSCVAAAGSRSLVATGSADRTVRLWSALAGHHRADLTLHSGQIRCLAATPDGGRLVTAAEDGHVRIWDVDGGCPGVRLPAHAHHVNCVAVAPGGQVVLTSYHNALKWHDLSSGRQIGEQRIGEGFIVQARFLGGADRVVTVCDSGAVEIWNLTSRAREHAFEGHATKARALDLTPDHTCAVTGCDGGRIRVWDLVGRRCLRTLTETGDKVRALRVRRDARAVICAEGQAVRIRDLRSGVPLVEAELSADVMAVDETADGQRVVAGLADGSVVLLRPEDGAVLWRLQVHSGATRAIACDPHGRWIATGGADGRVVILRRDRGAPPSILAEAHFVMGQAALRIELQLARASSIESAQQRLALRGDLEASLQARVQALLEDRVERGFQHDLALFDGVLDQDPVNQAVHDALAEAVARVYPDGSAGLALWHLRRRRPADALAAVDRLLEGKADWRQHWGFALLPIRAITLAQLGRAEQARAALAAARGSAQEVDPEYRAAAAQLLSEALVAVER